MTAPASACTDLTRPIRTGMRVFPGDPQVRVTTALSCAADGVEVSGLSLGSHTGTHVDAPAHTVPGGRTVDQLGLEELCGPALVLGLVGLRADQPITATRVRALLPGPAAEAVADPAAVPARVLLCTGWDRYADADGDDRALHHPVLEPAAARLLWDAGARLLGTDTLNPDSTLQRGPFRLPVHEVFLGGDGVIVESLTRLTAFRPRPAADWSAAVQVGIYPLPLTGRDGAPARVVARPQPTARCAPGAAGNPEVRA